MAKFHKFAENHFVWECPACGGMHHIQTDKNETPCWDFNGDLDNPTISPSVRVRGGGNGNDFCCHFFIRDGKVEFCSDSTHELAGQTVEIPDWEK